MTVGARLVAAASLCLAALAAPAAAGAQGFKTQSYGSGYAAPSRGRQYSGSYRCDPQPGGDCVCNGGRDSIQCQDMRLSICADGALQCAGGRCFCEWGYDLSAAPADAY